MATSQTVEPLDPQNRTETQAGMANYEHKLAELTKAVQTEAAKWSRTKAEWNARGKAMK